jgi:hypothetical protein
MLRVELRTSSLKRKRRLEDHNVDGRLVIKQTEAVGLAQSA